MKNQYTGPATVFRHDKNGRTFYSIPVSRKNSEGETEFAYKLVQFKKGVDLADRTKIEIRNGWETFYKNKDGEDVFYVFISDFVIMQGSGAGYQQQGYQQGYQQPAQYPQNYVQQQFQPRGYQRGYQQKQQPAPQDFEQINEDVPF